VGILSVLALERLQEGGGPAPPDPAVERPVVGPPPGSMAGVGPPGAVGDGVPQAIRWRLEELAGRLELDEERTEKFLEIHRRFFIATRARRGRILQIQERFRRELAASEPSRETLDAMARQLGEELAGLDADFATSVLETRALLGPEKEEEYLRVLSRLRPPGLAGGQAPGPGPAPGELPRRPRRWPGR
jgi:hypothetical protein